MTQINIQYTPPSGKKRNPYTIHYSIYLTWIWQKISPYGQHLNKAGSTPNGVISNPIAKSLSAKDVSKYRGYITNNQTNKQPQNVLNRVIQYKTPY